MKRAFKVPSSDQNGFIPMILTIVVVMVAVIYFAFKRVIQAQQ
jgi:hypothetical protein